MSLDSEQARGEDDGANTRLDNFKGDNQVAKKEAQIAVEAAHRALMGQTAQVRDARENETATKAEEENQ